MRFIETPVFTRRICNLISDESYRALQLALLFRPEQGAIIPGSNGLRKVRWRSRGHGKRGGFRIIYYWDKANDTIYMLFIYAKADTKDLTPKQINTLAKAVQEDLR